MATKAQINAAISSYHWTNRDEIGSVFPQDVGPAAEREHRLAQYLTRRDVK